MGCGCAERRKFSQSVNPAAHFSIANEATGKSAEGAWIKSTEGARGFGGLKWFHSQLVQFAALDYGTSILLYGDVTSSFPTTGYQTEVYENGVLWLTLPTESGTTFVDFPSWNTSCGTFQTPDGLTVIDYDSVDKPAYLDPHNSVTMRFVNSSDSSDIVITLDPMTHCSDGPGVRANWNNPA